MPQVRHPEGTPGGRGGQFAPGPAAPEFGGTLTMLHPEVNRELPGCELSNGEPAQHLIVGDEFPYCARCGEEFDELSTLNPTGEVNDTDRFDGSTKALLALYPGKEAITPDEVTLGDTIYSDHRGRSTLTRLGVVTKVTRVSDLGRYEIVFDDGRGITYNSSSPVIIDNNVGYVYDPADRWPTRRLALASKTTTSDVLARALEHELHTDALALIAAHPNATDDQIHKCVIAGHQDIAEAALGNANTSDMTLRWITHHARQQARESYKLADTASRYRDYMPPRDAALRHEKRAERAVAILHDRGERLTPNSPFPDAE